MWTTSPEASVYDAIRIMGERQIGAIVVMEEEKLVGILSERDYSRKVVLKGRTSRDTKVREIASSPVITVTPQDGIDRCMDLMTNSRIRYLPVVGTEGSLVGIVSMGDVVKWVMQTQKQTIQMLQRYISGEYPG